MSPLAPTPGVVILPAMLVHQTSGRLAARALGAALLVEHASTAPEREAAIQLAAVVRRAGVVAEPLLVPGGGRLTDDGLLMSGGVVGWQPLLLAGMAPAFGFDQAGGAFTQDRVGRWRTWLVGPPATVVALRGAYACAVLHVALAVAWMGERRAWGALAATLGVVGELRGYAQRRRPSRALVRWEGREPPPDDSGKPAGEATEQLRAFGEVVGLLYREQIGAGMHVADDASLWL